ncbi:MAG: efflux RND transporter periplasmic adaptor subunit [Bacteroidetes bacterium]|nr:MAG: efflux RND transporter periplasmic adaptor subunit [Bacteroidota bacterium]
MNSNIKVALIALIGLLLGLGIGYALFGGKHSDAMPAGEHHHDGAPELTSAEETIWTCSMHPQIRQNEPGKCPICGMDLIPLSEMGDGSSSNPLELQMTEEAVKLANIQTTVVGATGKAEKKVLLTGKIQPDERLAASQVAHIPGRIEQLYVTFTGETVRKGQKLATVYSPDLITAQRELLEALRFQDVNPAMVEAARNKLRYWKFSDETIAEIEKAGTVRETFDLLADAAGVVTHRRVAVGDYVKTGQILFDLVSLNRLWVLFDAYEEDLADIKVGDRVSFTVPVLPGESFTTRITFIDPVINPKTRTAALRGEIANRGNLLKPEMFVRGEIKPRLDGKARLLVPKSAVLWTGPRSVVYVKVPDATVPSFEFREIELGESTGDSYLVKSGLEPGEEVVTYGNFAIDAAAQLNNQTSMMNRLVKVKKTTADEIPDYRAETPDDFKAQLQSLSEAYLALKDALVATDAATAAQAAQKFLDKLAKVDMTLLKGEVHLFWMDQLSALKGHGGKIVEETDVEAQRTQFDFLSQAMIKTLKAFGIKQGTFYVQHCPMVNGNKGADWISLDPNIKNPYFGEKMLTCGIVKDTIRLEYHTASE